MLNVCIVTGHDGRVGDASDAKENRRAARAVMFHGRALCHDRYIFLAHRPIVTHHSRAMNAYGSAVISWWRPATDHDVAASFRISYFSVMIETIHGAAVVITGVAGPGVFSRK
ncbi:hypothetical protein [Methanoregula sp.]|uniref:hypothetical protein n=1 Tax=Methanoregula sp. TaxID=2052170 RepID=UPI003BAF5B39